ncbi:MAG: DNA repair protein RecN [Burkholderiaceae bacterium]
MLRSLQLRDYVIVADARIPFGSGFTVLTGETGAGKSILIDALGLALGDRADARMVREGAARADICAEFATTPALDQRLATLDLTGDPGTLLLRRVVEADGRSRALVNGQPTTVAQLKEIGAALVDIHGQHESQRLLGSASQRQLIDRHGSLEAKVGAVAEAFARWQESRRVLDDARGGSRERQLRIDRLQAEITEIEGLQLAEGEWTAICDEQSRLAHARELVEGAQQAAEALARGDRTLSDSLRGLQSSLRPLAAIDPALRPALELVDSAQIQIDEVASMLSGYADRVDLDPSRLAEVESRVSAIHGAARRLRVAPEALPGHLLAARTELEALGGEGDLATLEGRASQAEADYLALARALSAARRKVATRFAAGVSKLIDRLAMPKAQLVVDVRESAPTASGVDAIEFAIAAHAGATARPIARFASGGELSRIGLAIATLAAADQPVPTLIFDEADAGIGGTVANVIGELMQRLGHERQVLCVTHLPQVASRADHHLLVARDAPGRGAGPVGRIEVLTADERVDEVARMLGAGKTSKAHAEEMLAVATRS